MYIKLWVNRYFNSQIYNTLTFQFLKDEKLKFYSLIYEKCNNLVQTINIFIKAKHMFYVTFMNEFISKNFPTYVVDSNDEWMDSFVIKISMNYFVSWKKCFSCYVFMFSFPQPWTTTTRCDFNSDFCSDIRSHLSFSFGDFHMRLSLE